MDIDKYELNIEYINKRIEKEICYKTLEELKDEKLINEYKNSNSVINKIKILETILEKYIDKILIEKIINEYLLNLIPAGTKGVIRGNKFNNIIKHFIINLNLNNDRFEICFEKKCKTHFTSEIPDFEICFKKNQIKLLLE